MIIRDDGIQTLSDIQPGSLGSTPSLKSRGRDFGFQLENTLRSKANSISNKTTPTSGDAKQGQSVPVSPAKTAPNKLPVRLSYSWITRILEWYLDQGRQMI